MLNVLYGHPAIARCVGGYIATFSELELFLSLGLSKALNEPGALSHAILHQFRNTKDRIDVVRDILSTMPQVGSVKLFSETLTEIEAALSFRNILAHGLYEKADDDSFEVWTWITSKGKRGDKILITEASLKLELLKLQNTLSRMRLVVGNHKATFPYKLKQSRTQGRQSKGDHQSNRR